MEATGPCPICDITMLQAGSARSTYSDMVFDLGRCPSCRCARVLNPRTDFDVLYDEAYYSGRGVDTKLDYFAELDDPKTLRSLEWQAIEQLASELVPLGVATRWLDMGCGVGGLVQHLRSRGHEGVVGHEQGFAAEAAAARGLPIFDDAELDALAGTFEVITAIEVIEHIIDPISFLERVADLLAPGGIFILTTGNVEHAPADLTDWYYLHPDVHLTFLGPTALSHAYQRVGLRPEFTGFRRPHVDIIRYKLLMTLHRKHLAPWQAFVPWSPFARLLDRRFGITAMPLGRKPAG